jgi:hypothetical protein
MMALALRAIGGGALLFAVLAAAGLLRMHGS